MKKVEVEKAVGMTLCHDITAMFDGFKGALYKRGHVIQAEDIPRLLDIGKKHVFIWEENGRAPRGGLRPAPGRHGPRGGRPL